MTQAIQKRNRPGGGELLGAMLIAYVDHAGQRSVERYRIRKEAQVAIQREREITFRYRIYAETEIARESEATRRVETEWAGRKACAREQRVAFERLCRSLDQALADGAITLKNIREQFGNICRLLIEREVDAEERKLLIELLTSLLAQQAEVFSNHQKSLGALFQQRRLQ